MISAGVTKYWSLTMFLLFIFFIKSLFLIEGKPQVPCLFFFGDSLFDNGNNNNLVTLAKVDYPPYGIDYPEGPTGRFCNGRNIPDFIAEYLDFEESVPPFANATEADYLTGVNYASGGGGILDYTNYFLGQRYDLKMQIEHHAYTVSQVERILGNAHKSKELLNKCMYISNIGNNDFLDYFLEPILSPATKLYTLDQYAGVLVQAYSKQLKILYSYGARKIAVFGTAPLGCIPQVLHKYQTDGKPCVEWINKDTQLFNTRLLSLVDQLNTNMPDAQFIFINYTAISYTDIIKFALSGFKVINIACCDSKSTTGLCYRDSTPCPDRAKFSFWDNYHPTEILNMAAAKRMYNASSPLDTYPMDLQQLALK
ncbi:GDSL esterase/lipase At1g29670-like isoform X1 [Primulina tabacum]|uniref:GDSL esterase/lipase At1g29670-like isoform X1 n=1 Tax=Primulina tabacum TaxID=48773 RepID=UPI003F5A57FF